MSPSPITAAPKYLAPISLMMREMVCPQAAFVGALHAGYSALLIAAVPLRVDNPESPM
ncbi:MAG: hypothetical protein FWG12_06370 [Holophagaceae bacterium]|nr:hypothetical protein [Holophagaceae bacterium]